MCAKNAGQTNLDDNRQGPALIAVGAGGGCWKYFSLRLSNPQYRLKHCVKEPLNPKIQN